MKKWLLLFVLAPFVATAQKAALFTIEGKLDGGYPEGTEIKLYKNGENTEAGSANLTKGKFVLQGKVEEPTLCYLVIGEEKPVEIYVENRIISFKANKSNLAAFTVEGSESHKHFAAFIKAFLPMVQQLSSLAGKINATPPGKDRDALMKTYDQVQLNIQNEIDKTIRERPESHVTAFLLNATYQFNEDPIVLEERFNKLHASIRRSAIGKQLETFIAENKIGAVGTQSLDFSQPDTSGTPVSLSSFRGKYVLIDFWASWCGPCREENPNVVETFQKFKDKNYTVLGVSLDRPGQKSKWLQAIHEDKLTWTHVSDLQFWNSSAAQLYKVKGIPQNFLVDPNGKIIARNLRGPALEAKLCEVLGCD